MNKIMIIGVIFILLLPSVLSFALRSGVERIYFEPSLKKTVSFIIENNDGVTKSFSLVPSTQSNELYGILDQVVHIKEQGIVIETGKQHEFYVDITLPNSLQYGVHEIFIRVVGDDPNKKEEEKEGAWIRVQTAVAFTIRIYSLYPGKYIEGRVQGPTAVNIGEIAEFRTRVLNIGAENIENARAKVDIYHDNNLVESIYSDSLPVASKEIKELFASLLIREGYKVGEYTTKTFVEYDGKTEDVGDGRFNVGALSIEILNITSNKFENNKINKFKIDVESKWNKPTNVYAELILTDFSGQEVANFKTQAITLGGWQKGAIPAYLDLNDIVNSNYMLKIILYYEEKMSRRTFAVQVSDTGEAEIVEEMPGMPKQTIIIILLSTVVALLVIIILMMFFRKKETTHNEYNEIR